MLLSISEIDASQSTNFLQGPESALGVSEYYAMIKRKPMLGPKGAAKSAVRCCLGSSRTQTGVNADLFPAGCSPRTSRFCRQLRDSFSGPEISNRRGSRTSTEDAKEIKRRSSYGKEVIDTTVRMFPNLHPVRPQDRSETEHTV